MIHSDDLEPGQYRWMEYRVRLLVPTTARARRQRAAAAGDRTLTGWFTEAMTEALTVDVLNSTPVGAAGQCSTCGLVTIETAGYPWGQDQYRVPSYCPHCTGGEDVG